MKRNILLTVIVPAYQAGKSIDRLLRSLLLWSGEDMEVIVVDDGSTDDTASIVSSISSRDPRVRLITQANGGRSSARNTGISYARGEWIMFADSDDYLLGSWQDAVSIVRKVDCDLLIFSMVRSDGLDAFGNLPERYSNLSETLLSAREVFAALVDASFGATVDLAGSFEWNACWSRLYRSRIVARVAALNGGEAFPVGLKFSEDRLFNLAYLKAMGDSVVTFCYKPVYYWDLAILFDGCDGVAGRLQESDSLCGGYLRHGRFVRLCGRGSRDRCDGSGFAVQAVCLVAHLSTMGGGEVVALRDWGGRS